MAPSFLRLLPILALGSPLPAAAESQEQHEFTLDYDRELHDSTRALPPDELGVEIHWRSGPVSDPELDGREVRPGVIRIGDDRLVRLAWDRRGKALFVDRDQDGELADEDPVGVLADYSDFLWFEEFTLQHPAGPEHGLWSLLPSIARSDSSYDSDRFRVRSGWSGDIELGGVVYQLGVFDDLDGVFTPGVDRLVLRVRSDEDPGPDFEDVALPGRVLLGEVLYDLSLSLEASAGKGGIVRARFTEISATRVECELLGTRLSKLLLEPTEPGPHSTLIFLEAPSGTMLLVEGQYTARIEIADERLGPLRSEVELVVEPRAENVLRAGCPLENSLGHRRASGSTLELEYRLLGIGGEEYTLGNRYYPAPTFVARAGDREVASGSFEYG